MRSYEKNCLHIDAMTTHLFVCFAAYDITMLSYFIAGNNITILPLHKDKMSTGKCVKVCSKIDCIVISLSTSMKMGLLMSMIKY